jgi:hypothetical protein
MGRVWVLGLKLFSLSLVFNCLLTVACAVGILAGYYWIYVDWHPFSPFLLSGALFWFVIAAAVVNVFPCACLGRSLKTGRFLFHHYFYGFLVLFCAVAFVLVFSPVPIFLIFFENDTSALVNVGRFFLLGGLTLVLDDLPDVSKRVEGGLNWLKAKTARVGQVVAFLQLVFGVLSFYLFFAVCLYLVANPVWLTVANVLLAGSVFFTSVCCFVFVKRGFWLRIGEDSSCRVDH